MARLPRLAVAHHSYHILQSGHDDRLIFQDGEDLARFRQILLEAAKKFGVAIHAYVFMPSHFHLLVTPSDDTALGKMMQWLGRHYVPYFNRKNQRSGTLWQGRYKSLLLDADSYFLFCSRYIESHPVRAGLAADPGAYAQSSYHHHIGAAQDALISDHPRYWNLGNTPFQREAAYGKLMEQSLTAQEIHDFSLACRKGWPLGSSQFKARLEKQTVQRIAPLKRGRPRTRVAAVAPAVVPESAD